MITISDLAEQRQQQQIRQIDDLGSRLSAINDELQAARHAGQRDPLTGLYNRASFDDRLNRTASLHHLDDQPACLALIDLDNFKWVNDRYGHPAGDSSLRALGGLLAKTFARKTDIAARYGGDELGLILPETTIEAATRLAAKLVKNARDLAVDHDGGQIRFTVSVGLAEIGRTETPMSWLDRADKALYQAKRAGRDRLVIADR